MTAELAAVAADQHAMGQIFYGSARTAADLKGRIGHNSLEDKRTDFVRHGGWILTDIPGGRDALREMVDPAMRDLVDKVEPCEDEALTHDIQTEAFASGVGATMVAQRVRDSSRRIVGTALVTKPCTCGGEVRSGCWDLDQLVGHTSGAIGCYLLAAWKAC